MKTLECFYPNFIVTPVFSVKSKALHVYSRISFKQLLPNLHFKKLTGSLLFSLLSCDYMTDEGPVSLFFSSTAAVAY